ncbi:MAG: hypothetical protein PHG00_17320, partial [Methylococcales bacterium]|nr:hypothetical protein [Methylococcales bacterium]
SPSDLKKPAFFDKALKEDSEYLALAGVIDDRSGFCYQEYHVIVAKSLATDKCRVNINTLYTALFADLPTAKSLRCLPKLKSGNENFRN